MPTKRAPRSAAKAHTETRSVTRTTGLVLLSAGLALSAYNLALMTSKSGTLAGVSDSWATLQENYASSQTSTEEPIMEQQVSTVPPPVVLSSVVRWREGEEDLVRMNLVSPILSYHETSAGDPLTAMLIERKNANSRDVSVRLFYAGGKEDVFLWPSERSQNGIWLAPVETPTEEPLIE